MGATLKRINELDSLRGIAAISVMLFHYTTKYDEWFMHVKLNYSFNFVHGQYGVQLFFMISGFVIYMTLLKASSVKMFVQKRAQRLYPAYITAVFFTFLVIHLSGVDQLTVSLFDALVNLTMFQGFLENIQNVDGVYWSLRVELSFYILIVMILFFRLFHRIALIMLIWLGLSSILKILPANLLTSLLIVDYCHFFIAGICFFYIKKENHPIYHIILLLCLLYEAVFFPATSFFYTVGFFLLFYLLVYKQLSLLNWKPLTFLGTISYSLYLIHQNIGYVIIQLLEKHGFVHELYLIIPCFISIVLASFITYGIEIPVQAFFSRQSRSISQPFLSKMKKAYLLIRSN